MLYACSKCFTRHPFEELSQGQQLCKKCRGDFPVVKCTYCRSEFQQENKNKTSSICKRCEQCVAQYGKPTSCSYCQLPAAFVGGKCQRCSSYSKRYGAPKTCEQCKQKSAFDKGDNSKLMCWACSCSYKRALAKTKQSDPARHSRVFKKEKRSEEGERHKKREKYMNSKKPNRPDVTKMEIEPHAPVKIVTGKKETRDGDTDHVGEITQLKEKIVFLEKTIKQKENQMITKDREITQMKAQLFNEERLIREKMKKMASVHDDKITELNVKIRSLQSEISRLRKDARQPTRGNKKMDNLFKDSKKRTFTSRTASPAGGGARSPSPQRSKSKSPQPAVTNSTGSAEDAEMTAVATSNSNEVVSTGNDRSSSQSPSGSRQRSRSKSPTAAGSRRSSRSSSPPPAKLRKQNAAVVSDDDERGEEENDQNSVPATVVSGDAETQSATADRAVAGEAGGSEAVVDDVDMVSAHNSRSSSPREELPPPATEDEQDERNVKSASSSRSASNSPSRSASAVERLSSSPRSRSSSPV